MVPKELQEARETFEATVAGAQEVIRGLHGRGRFPVEAVESLIETLLAQLEVSDALMVRFLGSGSVPSDLGNEAVSICILALRMGAELGYRRSALGKLGVATLVGAVGRSRMATEDGVPTNRRSRDERVEAEHAQVIRLATTYRDLVGQRGGAGRSWPPAALKELLQCERGRFPDRLLKALIQVLTTLPIGGLVRLNSGEIGYVVAKNADSPLRPVVAVWMSLGKRLAEAKLVDLKQSRFLGVKEFLGDADLDPALIEAAP